ncbi:MAG: hypothetical protein ABR549_02050 [Mycobacteriales bacterium]
MTTPEEPNAEGHPTPGGYGPPPADPPPGYGTPPPGYGTPPPGYGTPPPGYGPPQPGYGAPPPGYGAPQANSTPLVLGIIGIVLAFCCWPVGLALGIISYVQANKQPGGNTTIGMVAIGLNILLGIIGIVMIATGHGFVYYRNG